MASRWFCSAYNAPWFKTTLFSNDPFPLHDWLLAGTPLSRLGKAVSLSTFHTCSWTPEILGAPLSSELFRHDAVLQGRSCYFMSALPLLLWNLSGNILTVRRCQKQQHPDTHLPLCSTSCCESFQKHSNAYCICSSLNLNSSHTSQTSRLKSYRHSSWPVKEAIIWHCSYWPRSVLSLPYVQKTYTDII